jgi:glycine cleavage system H protein
MATESELQYTAEHEWVLVDGSTATVGITAYAAEKLGDVVYVDLPDVGTALPSS